MSCVCILTPVVIAAWPALSATVIAAATSMGYTIVKESPGHCRNPRGIRPPAKSVEMEIVNSQVVTERLGRDQKIIVARDGVTITFCP